MAQSNANVIDSSMVPDTVVSVRDLFGIDLDLGGCRVGDVLDF